MDRQTTEQHDWDWIGDVRSDPSGRRARKQRTGGEVIVTGNLPADADNKCPRTGVGLIVAAVSLQPGVERIDTGLKLIQIMQRRESLWR
jgi:hypothetical protein